MKKKFLQKMNFQQIFCRMLLAFEVLVPILMLKTAKNNFAPVSLLCNSTLLNILDPSLKVSWIFKLGDELKLSTKVCSFYCFNAFDCI